MVSAAAVMYTLRGRSFEFASVPINFFLPELKVFEHHSFNPVRQLDVTAVWRGLSSIQAEELSFWEGIFRSCLLRRIHPYLKYNASLQKRYNGSSLGPKLAVSINISQLVFDMVTVYEETPEFGWFANNDLLPMVSKFIDIHDCFTTASTVDILATDSGNDAELKWCPPQIVFDDLVVTLYKGQTYRLRPRVQQSLSFNAGECCINYSTDCPWLQYQNESESFSGKAPHFAEQIQIIVNATITHTFGGVIHQQIVRAAVAVDVQPAALRRESNIAMQNMHHFATTRCNPKDSLAARTSTTFSTLPTRTARLPDLQCFLHSRISTSPKRSDELRSLFAAENRPSFDDQQCEGTQSLFGPRFLLSADPSLFGSQFLPSADEQEADDDQNLLVPQFLPSADKAGQFDEPGNLLGPQFLPSADDTQADEPRTILGTQLPSSSDKPRLGEIQPDQGSQGSPFMSRLPSPVSDILSNYGDLMKSENPFALIANCTDMDRPSTALGKEGIVGASSEKSLFDVVHSQFRVDYNKVKAYRQPNASGQPNAMDSSLLLPLSPPAEGSRLALDDATNNISNSLPTDEEAVAKCVRAVQRFKFGSDEDLRDIRQMKAEMLKAELAQVEKKMTHGRGVQRWVGSEDFMSGDFNMECIEESEME